MQKYKEKLNVAKLSTINSYIYLKIVLNQEKVGSSLGITIAYAKHLKMFEEYLDLQRLNHKTTFIISYLANKYQVSESTVKRVIRKMLHEVTV